jgi:predicted heme/steroid binding protein
MDIPDRIVTIMELRRNTGGRGTHLWTAYDGIVYDVTDCPKWCTGLHELLHFTGQDLTSEMLEAPHKLEVLNHDCVKVVGKLS